MTDTFQWERDSGSGFADIPGETNAAYTIVADDVGASLRARGYRDGNLVGESNSIRPVASAPAGTKTYAGGDFAAFCGTLADGDVVVLEADVTNPPVFTGYAPNVTFVSADAEAPATIHGRIDIRGDIHGWTFHTVRLDDSAAAAYQVSWVIGGTRITFRQCSATNGNKRIGFEFIHDSTYGFATDCAVDRCHIHDIGRLPYGSTNNDHGIYDIGTRTVVTDTLIEDCSDRGLQCRGGKSSVYQYVTIQNCGEGIIFGDLSATGCSLTKSVLLDNQVTSRHLIETYGANSGNVVDDCYAHNSDSRQPVQSSHSGLTVTNLHDATPPGSGYGPRYPVGC